METMIQWLITVERFAAEVYAEAAEVMPEQDELASLLRELAEDELWHFHLMNSAMNLLPTLPVNGDGIAIDDTTRRTVETPLLDLKKGLSAKTMSRDLIHKCIITAEYSEWNRIFVYVMQSLASVSREFERVASVIQRHEHRIESYFRSHDDAAPYVHVFDHLEPVWSSRLLIVDDYPPIVTLLGNLFRNEFTIDTAANGAEALALATSRYYDVIISDMDMPVMNGLALYKELSRVDEAIREQMILFTGDHECEEYFIRQGIHYLLKPSTIHDIQKRVRALSRR